MKGMGRISAGSRWTAAIVCIFVLAGCAQRDASVDDEARSLRLSAVLADSSFRIAVAGDSTIEDMISAVLGAVWSPTTERIVVLDMDPPHLRFYRPNGTMETALARSGNGPQEIDWPETLALVDDTLVIVANSTRLLLYGVDQQFRGQYRQASRLNMAFTRGCDDRLLAYGSTMPWPEDPERTNWLTHITPEADTVRQERAGIVERNLRDERRGVGGRPYGMIRTGDSVLVWHEYGPRPGVYSFRCDRDPSTALVRAIGDSGIYQGSSDPRVSTTAGTRPMARGMIMTSQGLLLVQSIVERRDTVRVTLSRFVLHRPDGDSTVVAVPGRYMLRDGRPGLGALIQASDPVHPLFVVREEDLLAAFN